MALNRERLDAVAKPRPAENGCNLVWPLCNLNVSLKHVDEGQMLDNQWDSALVM